MPRSAARSGAGQESLAPLLPPFRASPSPSPRYLNLALVASADDNAAASDDDVVLDKERAEHWVQTRIAPSAADTAKERAEQRSCGSRWR